MQLRESETLCEEAYKKVIDARKYLRDIVLSSTGFPDAEWLDDKNTLLVNVPDPEPDISDGQFQEVITAK
jgi:hypothetical protein